MQGYELTDFEWGVIAPLLPNKPRGVPRVDDSPRSRTTCSPCCVAKDCCGVAPD